MLQMSPDLVSILSMGFMAMCFEFYCLDYL